MKKCINILLFFCAVLLLTGCDSKKSPEEVMGNARQEILAIFPTTSIKNLYVELPSLIYIDKEAVFVSWSSSNANVIESTTGRIYRDIQEKTVLLTAYYSYSGLSDSITFNLRVNADEGYFRSSALETIGNELFRISVKRAYVDDGKLYVEIYFYNNDPNKVVAGLSEQSFSIIDINTNNTLVTIQRENMTWSSSLPIDSCYQFALSESSSIGYQKTGVFSACTTLGSKAISDINRDIILEDAHLIISNSPSLRLWTYTKNN